MRRTLDGFVTKVRNMQLETQQQRETFPIVSAGFFIALDFNKEHFINILSLNLHIQSVENIDMNKLQEYIARVHTHLRNL